jgi:Ca2+-binding RTX toxin-like protein
LIRPATLRLTLGACLVLVPLVMGAAPANAVLAPTNTAPDCSSAGDYSYRITANPTATLTTTSVDVIANCFDADGQALDIVSMTPPSDAGASIVQADGSPGSVDTIDVTPDVGFLGRNSTVVGVTDGIDTTYVTVSLHVVGPTDYVECGANTVNSYKYSDSTYDYDYLPCSTDAPDSSSITYTLGTVTPGTEAANVVLHDVDDGTGTMVPTVTFNDQISASLVTAQVTATDTTGATDTFSIAMENRHDPVCTAPQDDSGYVTLSQRSNAQGPLTEDLGCADPDTTPLSYTAPTFYPPNEGDPAPGTLTVSTDGVVTFTPTDPSWTGRAYFTGGNVTDGNGGYINLDVLVDRYQQADLSVAFSAPSTATIGSSYTATMHVLSKGPDTVSGFSVFVGVPQGSVIGTVPSACQAHNGSNGGYGPFLVCDYPTLAADADFNVAIPLTAGSGSVAGSNEIGAQYYGDNLRNSNTTDPMTSAHVNLVSPAVVTPGPVGVPGNDVVLGSAAGTTISTGAGDDSADGGGGNDLLLLGAGNDCGQGGAGNDVAHGDDGNDAVYGDAGPCVTGKASTSRLMAAISGNDRLFGDAGNDVLFGGPGADVLNGGSGKDRFVGGSGNDVIKARDHVRGEKINCGAGRDTVYADKGDLVAKNCEKVHRR